MFDTTPTVEDVADAALALAGRDARLVTDDDLLRGAVAIERARSLLAAAEAHWLAELEARQLCDDEHGMRTPAWVAHEARCSPSAVRRHLMVGQTLRHHLPSIDRALCTGELSWDHVDALAAAASSRVLDLLGDLEGEIVASAAELTFSAWRHHVRRLVDLVDQDGPRSATDPTTNRAHVSESLDGVVHLDATFTAEHGTVVRQALERITDELFRRAARDHEACPELVVPNRAQLRALALVELIRRGLAGDPAARRSPQVEVSLIVRDGEVTDDHGRTADPTAARTWACDADWVAVVLDGRGVLLDVGRRHRFATSDQRRAVSARDGGCVFPGCDQPIGWCDVHHVDWWEHGGPTDLRNLAALCRHHHMVTHRRGWAMVTTDDQRFRWTTPAGVVLESQRHHRRPRERAPGPGPTIVGDASRTDHEEVRHVA